MARKEVINISTVFSADIANINNGIKTIRKNLEGIKLSTTLEKNFLNVLSKLETEMTSFEAKTQEGLGSKLDSKSFEKSGKRIIELYRQLQVQVKSLGKLSDSELQKMFPDSFGDNIKKSIKTLSDYERQSSKTTAEIKKQTKALDSLQKEQAQLEKTRSIASKKKSNISDSEYDLLKKQRSGASAKATRARGNLTSAENNVQQAINDGARTTKSGALDGRIKSNQELIQSLRTAQEEVVKTSQLYEQLDTKFRGAVPQSQIDDEQRKIQNELLKTSTKISELKQNLSELETSNITSFEKLKNTLTEITKVDFSNIENSEQGFEEIAKAINSIQAEVFNELRQNINGLEGSTDNLGDSFDNIPPKIKGISDEIDDLTSRERDIENLKNQALQFFSIGNAVQLFKRAVHSALETVKELDKTMTETAVVTDFTVGDMWSQLPRYSKSASELGISINSAYQAETLYYQQGLKTNQVIGVSTETLKMARIAGMEAVDATNMMTAALRGFNMEVNEMNAQRVNDVYSELAAITAADTQEIGTAMSKTASIAKSANMEFETTAALLSQIIETTREAPETAGTAMKTIVARFTEVKKLISEGQLTGSDEEGEIIDVNKIDTALKAVGLSLTGFMQGTEGIDDIFLKLAEKWGTLDVATQRYIATMAAGSRQQSRFLAMMGDYDRTMELVSAANNSAGASQEQFSKTLESMETKLAKLKNAWDTFAMGLANNKILKDGIDTLTWLLNTINNITNAISGGNGIVKAILSIGLAFGGLKLGGAIFNKIFSNLGKTFADGGKNAGEGFSKGFMGTIKKVFTKNFWVGVAPNASNFSTDTAVKALDNLKKAQNNLAQATKIRNNAIKNNIGSQATQEALNKKVSSSEAACATATTAYGAALGLTNAQQALYNSMTSAGISGDVAALAIKNGLTIQEYNLMAATIASTAADEAEAKAKMKVALASFGVIGAKTTEEAVDKAGLLTRIKDLAIRLFSVKATNKMTIATLLGIGAKTTETGATIAATGAQTAFNAAIYACPLGWILLAILAVVGAIIGLAAAFKAASDEAKMENLNEQVEYFKDAAEEARNKIQEITDTKSSLDDLQDSFAGLSRGTKEWKAKLVEVNQKVLELINTYPTLAKFLEKGSEGQLSIKDEGYNALLDEQQKMLTNSLVSQSALTMQKQDLQNKMNFEEQVSSTTWGTKAAMDTGGFLDSGWGKALQWITNPVGTAMSTATGQYGHAEENAQKATTGGLTQEQYTNFAAAAVEGGLSISGETSEEEFRELYLDMGFDESSFDSVYSKMQALGSNFDELANSSMGLKTAQEAQEAALIEAIASGNEEILSSEFAEQAKDLAGSLDVNTLIQKEAAGITEGKGDLKKLYAEEVGGYYNGKDLYLDENYTQKMEISDDEMRTAIAAGKVNEKLADGMKNTIAELNRLQSELGQGSAEFSKLKRLISAEGQGMTQKDLLETESLLVKDKTWAELSVNEQGAQETAINEYLGSIGTSLEALELSAEQFYGNIMTAADTAAKASAGLQAKGIKEDSYKDLSIDTVSNLSKQTENMSNEAAQKYVENFNKVLSSSNLGESGTKQLETYLSAVDWSNMTDAVKAMDYMQEMGLDQSIIESYWKTGVDGANAYVSTLSEILSLTDRMQQKLSSIADISSRLEEGTASYEDMQKLVEAGADIGDFQLTPEGWKATAEQIGAVTDKMKEYNAEQARDMADHQRQEFNEAKKLAQSGYGAADKELTTFEDGVYKGGDLSTVDKSIREDAATQLGIQQGENETEDAFLTRLQAAYNSYISLLNNGEDIQIIADKQAAMAEAAKYTASENEARGGPAESIIYSAQNEATEAGLDANEMMQYADTLRQVHTELDEVTAAQVALANSKMNAGLGEIIDSYDEWSTILDKDTGALKDTSAEGVATYNKLKASANKMLNTSEDLSDAFWDNAENMKNIEKAAKGDTKALGELQKAAAKDFLINLDAENLSNTAENAINDFLDYYNNIEIPPMEPGVNMSEVWSGAEEFRSAFNQMAQDANLSAEQIQKAAQNMGFDANVTYVEQTRRLPMYSQTETKTENGDGTTTITSGTPVITGYENVTGFFPVVETFTPTGTGGGGVSVNNKKAGSAKGNKGGGGGGSKKSEKQHWENPYDELRNLTEKANTALRNRNSLEREYDIILQDRSASAQELLNNSLKQLANLRKEISLQKQLLQGRQKQLKNAKNAEYLGTKKSGDDEEQFWTTYAQEAQRLGLGNISQYASINEKTGEITIDWSKIEAIEDNTKKGEDQGALIEAYVSYLEEIQGNLQETQDTIEDMEDQVREIQERGKAEYVDFEQRIYDALVARDQKVIDNYQELSNTISKSNTDILDSLQESIDLERQIRDNTKTEEDIAEKEARLAYLRRDTSGANALEIKQLEEELKDAREAYGDTLVDQEIQRLTKVNEDAIEQRERQIEIMQSQLDYAAESGQYWAEVSELLSSAFNADGSLNNNSALVNLLKETEGFKALSEFGGMQWIDQLIESWLSAQDGLGKWKVDKAKQDKNGVQTTNAGKLAYNSKKGVWEDGKGGTYSDIAYDPQTGKFTASGYTPKASKPSQSKNSTQPSTGKLASVPAKLYSSLTKSEIKSLQEGLNNLLADKKLSGFKKLVVDGIYGPATTAAVKKLQSKIGTPADGKWGKNTAGAFKKSSLKAYKAGGMIDFTGPAWLDGSKSKPESMLDAIDTKNFIQLKEILAEILKGASISGGSDSGGDNYFDVNIAVDSLSNDYDVEKLATKVKDIINSDARYRNVNSINFLR